MSSRSTAGTPLLIRDVAEVSVGAVPRQGLVGRDDEDEIVAGIVLMRKGENPSEVLREIKERVDHLNTSVLPEGVRIVPFYDRSWLIATTLTTVFRNLIEGALLVTLVLYVFLRNGRAAGIVAAIIPLALLATFIGLRLRGIPANLLSLGAMDFGIIVDGAVIVVENVFRTLAERGRTIDRESREADGARRDGPGRAADALLDADHHRREHSDLHAPAAGRAHLRADGVHDFVGARSAR